MTSRKPNKNPSLRKITDSEVGFFFLNPTMHKMKTQKVQRNQIQIEIEKLGNFAC